MSVLLRVFGVLWFLAGLVMFLVLYAFLYKILGTMPSDPAAVSSLELVPTLTFTLLTLLFSISCLANGYLLFTRKLLKASRLLSCIFLLAFPIGTVLSIVTLILLSNPKIKALYSPVNGPVIPHPVLP